MMTKQTKETKKTKRTRSPMKKTVMRITMILLVFLLLPWFLPCDAALVTVETPGGYVTRKKETYLRGTDALKEQYRKWCIAGGESLVHENPVTQLPPVVSGEAPPLISSGQYQGGGGFENVQVEQIIPSWTVIASGGAASTGNNPWTPSGVRTISSPLVATPGPTPPTPGGRSWPVSGQVGCELMQGKGGIVFGIPPTFIGNSTAPDLLFTIVNGGGLLRFIIQANAPGSTWGSGVPQTGNVNGAPFSNTYTAPGGKKYTVSGTVTAPLSTADPCTTPGTATITATVTEQ